MKGGIKMRNNKTLLIVLGILGLVLLSRMTMGFGHMGLMGRDRMNYNHMGRMNMDYNRGYYGNNGYGYYNNGHGCR